MNNVLSAVLLVLLALVPAAGHAADVPNALKIDRIMLYFDNKRAETTVERAGQRIQAYVDLRYAGSGLLEGHWEVDGRVLSRVSQHISGGRSITLQVPKSPGIPTMDPGTHILRFVPLTPAPGLPVPSILYFVLAKDAKKTKTALKQNSPEEGTQLDFGPATFSWQQFPDVEVYLISFFEKAASKPIYSAYTKEAVYELAGPTLEAIFSPGRKYVWKVTGYDIDKNEISEQKAQGFSFRK